MEAGKPTHKWKKMENQMVKLFWFLGNIGKNFNEYTHIFRDDLFNGNKA